MDKKRRAGGGGRKRETGKVRLCHSFSHSHGDLDEADGAKLVSLFCLCLCDVKRGSHVAKCLDQLCTDAVAPHFGNQVIIW